MTPAKALTMGQFTASFHVQVDEMRAERKSYGKFVQKNKEGRKHRSEK